MARLDLADLRARIVERVIAAMPDVREGVVMTPGPKPYRRIDCDGRALAYLRLRSRKHAVRVDVSGLWIVRRECPIRHSTASGSATLYAHDDREIAGIVAFLADTVQRTRAAYQRERDMLAGRAMP